MGLPPNRPEPTPGRVVGTGNEIPGFLREPCEKMIDSIRMTRPTRPGAVAFGRFRWQSHLVLGSDQQRRGWSEVYYHAQMRPRTGDRGNGQSACLTKFVRNLETHLVESKDLTEQHRFHPVEVHGYSPPVDFDPYIGDYEIVAMGNTSMGLFARE